MKHPAFIPALFSAALLAGCGQKSTTVVTVPATPVELALQAQVDAMNTENLPAFMSYLHPENPNFGTTETATRKLFADFELRNELEKIETVSLTEGEAKVKFVQVTRKISGPAFRDNRVAGTHTLRKDNGVWKILSTEADGIVYLDGAG